MLSAKINMWTRDQINKAKEEGRNIEKLKRIQ